MEEKIITVTLRRRPRCYDSVHRVRCISVAKSVCGWSSIIALMYRIAAVFSVIVALAMLAGTVYGTTPIVIGIFSVTFFAVMAVINERWASEVSRHD